MTRWKGIGSQRLLWVFVTLLAIGCLAAAAIAGTIYYRSADQTDLTIDLIPENGYTVERVISLDQMAAPAQTLADSRWTVLPQQMAGLYEIRDQYDVVWDTDTKVEIFKTSYTNEKNEITVAGKGSEKVIAPGTENDYTFALRNNGSGTVDYKVTMKAFFEGLSDDKVIPVEVRVTGVNGWLLGDGITWAPVLQLNEVEESAVVYSRNAAVYKLEWRWPFESGQDELDTWLANQEEEITLTIQIITQSSYHHPSQPAITEPIPSVFDRSHIAYIYGYEDGTVRPNASITRAEVAAIFYRLLKTEVRSEYYTLNCAYPDVPEDAWYRTEVATMTNMGIVKGYPDGTFRPDDPITRAELSTILARFVEENKLKVRETAFSDIDGHWAEKEIRRIEEYSWIEGYPDSTFRPDNPITRAETVTMVNRMLHRLPEQVSDLLSEMHIWPDNADPEAWYYIAIQEASHTHECHWFLGTREKWTHITKYPYETMMQ